MTSEVEHRLSQFADDTTLILDGSEGSFLRAIEDRPEGFQATSGLKVNYEKTKWPKCSGWVRPKKRSNRVQQTRCSLGGRESFRISALGVSFSTDRNVILRSNCDERIVKINQRLLGASSRMNWSSVEKTFHFESQVFETAWALWQINFSP